MALSAGLSEDYRTLGTARRSIGIWRSGGSGSGRPVRVWLDSGVLHWSITSTVNRPFNSYILLKANFGPFRRGSSGLVAGLCWAVLGARVEATRTAVWHILGC